MSIGEQFIEIIKEKTVLSEVISLSVPLKKKGSNLWGCCPFHKEKTASFSVDDRKGFYHCFGCGVHGDAISFLMEQKGFSFTETLEFLAGRLGIPMPEATPQQAQAQKIAKNLYDLHDVAANYFAEKLWLPEGAKALGYLKNRGLSDETIRFFKIGLSSGGWDSLTKHLINFGFSPAQCVEAGLSIKNDQGSLHDRFRDRIMFPILNMKKRVIAFGGRILGDGEPKYLNSPETPIFHKGSELFNLGHARDEAHKQSKILVVEGYMDVISLWQNGIHNVVAPLGTAITEDQLAKLWKVCPQMILSFDGDAAGQRASWRALERMLPLLTPELGAQFLQLPTGHDPDTLVQEEGAEKFKARMHSAPALSDYVFARYTQGKSFRTAESLARLESDLSRIAQEIKDNTLKKNFSFYFNQQIWQKIKSPKNKKGDKDVSLSHPKTKGGAVKIDDILIFYLLKNPILIQEFEEQLMHIRLSPSKNDLIRGKFLEYVALKLPLDPAALIDYLKSFGLTETVEKILERTPKSQGQILVSGPDVQDKIQDFFRRHYREQMEQELKNLQKTLRSGNIGLEKVQAFHHLKNALDKIDVWGD